MIFDTRKVYEAKKAMTRLESLIDKNKVVEVKELRKKRTISQNSYMHVLFTLYGIETGYTSEEAKTVLKRECVKLMVYDKDGEKFLRSTADLSKDECQVFIDWVRNFASSQGIYLPSSEEYLENQVNIDREIDRNTGYI